MRQAIHEDVPAMARLNRAAYPDLAGEGVVWEEAQLREHQAVFPGGQIVAELDGALVGAIATFIVPRAVDPLAPHTWLGMTDGGYLKSHDIFGDTLYLADVYVDPAHWGRGVGARLYRALFDLCDARGLRRVVAGGRLWGYHEYQGRMTPDEYARRVITGEIHDRVLRSQIKAGFELRGILPGYLLDARSGDFATLLEWVSPAFADVTKESSARHAIAKSRT